MQKAVMTLVKRRAAQASSFLGHSIVVLHVFK